MAWRKSTHSMNQGNCIEVDDDFRKSSFCDAGTCVEVGQQVAVRDTADRGGVTLAFTPKAWMKFLAGLR